MARNPAYTQLAEQVITDLTTGRYAVGDLLPTEAQLCATTGLSRGTVRQALEQVERLGMISRRPRHGSEVISTMPVEDYQPVVGSADDIMALVRRTQIVRPDVRDVVVGRALARRTGARVGSRWQLIEGLRVQRDRPELPLCWSEQFVRPGPETARIVLHAQFSAEEAAATETEQVVSAEPLDPELAARLQTSSLAALVVTRRHRDQRGRLVSIGIHTHPGDRYSLRTVIAPRKTL